MAQKKINLNIEFTEKQFHALRLARIALQTAKGKEMNWKEFILELIE